MKTLTASKTPLEDIARLSYPGQDPRRKQYRHGYEGYLDYMPILNDTNPSLVQDIETTKYVMGKVATRLKESSWINEDLPGQGQFFRTILAIAESKDGEQGTELVLAQWGDGMTSPVHGHAAGYLHEDILYGKMLVNTYFMTSETSDTVRTAKTEIVTNGIFASSYTKKEGQHFARQALIHNFKSIGNSASLHYLPEHTRDGRDNKFNVEYFEDEVILYPGNLTRITAREGMFARPGDVLLVRSNNVPDYGDHFIAITGHPVMKEHGLRPQDHSIQASPNITFNPFDNYPGEQFVLLKLSDKTAKQFIDFHQIQIP